ncbi:MAG: phosphate signaling complex protein PhoU [Spirochaetaceae bacterium]|nr:phosphate signaling complex protein PhoU [Spirochaetaceae bacterium]
MSLRQHFEEDIANLNKNILKMGLLVEEAIENALIAFKNKDFNLAEKVIAQDKNINQMENDLCDQSVLILAKEQPVASDLRHILAGIKIISQLERMGDHAVHICKRTINIGTDKYIKSTLVNFPKMEELGRHMLVDSLNAFVEGDVDLAREVSARDQEIDDIYDKVEYKLLEKIQKENEKIEQGVELLFISRFLERFGDHVTNICEWVIFSKEGTHENL